MASSCLILMALAVLSGVDEPVKKTETVAKRLAAVAQAWHEAGQFDGTILVADQGRIIWQGGVGFAVHEWKNANGPAVRYPIASLSKQFTSVLVMQCVERGQLDLDGSICDYLPKYRADTGRRIRIRHLLSHASGLPEIPTEVYFDPRAEAEDPAWVTRVHGSGDLTFEPGSNFSYTNADYHVLQAILEKVTGVSFSALLEREVIKPLALSGTGIARRDAMIEKRANDYVRTSDGYRRTPPYQWENWGGAGGMYSTVGDLHRWNRALVEHELISKKTTTVMLTPQEGPNNYVALGSWVYPRRLPGSELQPTIVERRGAIGGFAVLNALITERQQWVVILANTYNEDIHTLPWANCLPLDLLMVLNGLTPTGPK